MKRMLFAIAILSMFFLTGLSSALNVVNIDNESEVNLSDESTFFEIKIPEKNFLKKDYDWRDYFQKYGIKIWARGYGTVNCKTIEGNFENHEFLEGSTDSNVWRVKIWPPENQMEYYKSAPFNYSFFDKSDETRINAMLTNFPISVLLLDMIRPGFAEKFRRNSKMPFLGLGPHELRKGHFFNGTITKGQTYKGEIIESKMVDTDGDGIEDTEAFYYEILAKVTYLFHVEENLDISPWDFWRISLYRLLYWKDPDFIPYDI